jgi:hypothetical protein
MILQHNKAAATTKQHYPALRTSGTQVFKFFLGNI